MSAPPDGIPMDERAFTAPWQVQAFAMTLALHEAGYFDWPTWADALARAIAAQEDAPTPDHAERYYACWLSALEVLVTDRALLSSAMLTVRKQEWARAVARTPHGQPIEIKDCDKE